MEKEATRFLDQPLARASSSSGPGDPPVRRPDAMDDEWAGAVPVFVRRGSRRELRGRGRPRVRRLLPRGHRRDGRALAARPSLTRSRSRCGAESRDAGQARTRSGAARSFPPLWSAVLAGRPDRDRREPVHDPPRARDNEQAEGPGPRVVLHGSVDETFVVLEEGDLALRPHTIGGPVELRSRRGLTRSTTSTD